MTLDRRSYSEKRDYVRMGLDCDVQCRRLPDGANSTARGRNLSTGGICLLTRDIFKVGDSIDIVIEPSQQLVPPFKALAEVVRVIPQSDGQMEIGAVIREILN